MSAANGGRGKPPVPPEGHGPTQAVVIGKQVTYQSRGTDCQRTEDGGLVLSFLVSEGGEPVRHLYIVGEKGRAAIRDAVNGGIEVAGANEMPAGGEA